MHSLLDRSTILAGLVDEVRPLLPQLGGALGDLCAGFGRAEAAEQALETAFMIRAAAEMLELDTLAECGRLLESVVPVLSAAPPELLKEGLPVVQALLGALNQATDGLVSRADVSPELMQSARQGVERLLEKQAAQPKAEPTGPLDLEALLATLPAATTDQAPAEIEPSLGDSAPAWPEPELGAADESVAPATAEAAPAEAESEGASLATYESWPAPVDEEVDHPLELKAEDTPFPEPSDHLAWANGWSAEAPTLPEQSEREETTSAWAVEPELLGKAEWLPEPLPHTNGVHGPAEAPARDEPAPQGQGDAPAEPEQPIADEDRAGQPAAELERPEVQPEAAESPVEQLWSAWSEPFDKPEATASWQSSGDGQVEAGQPGGFEGPAEAVGNDFEPVEPAPAPSAEPPARPQARQGLFSRFLSSLNGRRVQPTPPCEVEPPIEPAAAPGAEPVGRPDEPVGRELSLEPEQAAPVQAWEAPDASGPAAAAWEPVAESDEPAEFPAGAPAAPELAVEATTESEAPVKATIEFEPPADATIESEPLLEATTELEQPVGATTELEQPVEATTELEQPVEATAAFEQSAETAQPETLEQPWSWGGDLPEVWPSEIPAAAEEAPPVAETGWWNEPVADSTWAAAEAARSEPTEAVLAEGVGQAEAPEAPAESELAWSFEAAEPFEPRESAEAASSEPVEVISAEPARPRPQLPPLPPQQEVDPEILEVFKEEADEVLAEIGRQLVAVQADPSDKRAASELRRACHTLKGAANVVGFPTIGLACKTMEDLLDTLAEAGQSPTPAALSFLANSHATVRRLAEAPTEDGLLTRVAELYAEGTELTLGVAVSPAEPGEPEITGEEAAWARAVDAFLADEAMMPDGVAELGAPEPVEATPSALAEPGVPAISLPTSLDGSADELTETFAQEAEEHLAALSGAALRLDLDSSDAPALAEARRILHTLKGSAGALGLQGISSYCHEVESALEQQPPGERARLLFEAAETLEDSVAHLAATGQEAIRDLAAPVDLPEATLLPPPVEPAVESAAPRAEEPAAEPETPMAVELAPVAPLVAEAPEPAAAVLPDEAAASSAVRVELGRVDDLLNLVGEIVLSRTGLEQRLERVSRSADELRLTVARLRKVAQYLEDRYEVAELIRTSPDEPRYGEFDELEMDRYTELHRVSREVTELAADAETTSDEVEQVLKELDALAMRQARLGSDLQDKLMAVRLVPLSSLQARLHRTARSVALRQGKEVGFHLLGGETELDKRVIEELGDVLLHLIRNAVDHGIETPEKRTAAGKSAHGSLSLRAFREGSEAVVQLRDDGAGIDLVRLRQRAELLGLVGKEQELDQQELLELIFQPGISTSTATTEVSGRGVGLDVVRTAIGRLKGSIDVSSEPGQGTTFTLRLPVVLAVLQAMLVRGGDQIYAVPMSALERVVRSARRPVVSLGRAAVIELEGETFPFQDLALTLGRPAARRPGSEMPLLVVRTGDRRVALAVDELLGQQEVVVKALGPHLRAIRGVLGAALQGNGQVLLVLNTAELLTARLLLESSRASGAAAAPPVIKDGPLSALVVDDSLSVRKVLARALERDGWEVRQARDGVDALEVLQEYRPDVVLMDIEMPRMDGFELTGILRDVPDYGHPPVVMITSRGGEKHRKRADELGVAGYVVKPYQESDLLATLRQVAVVNARGSR